MSKFANYLWILFLFAGILFSPGIHVQASDTIDVSKMNPDLHLVDDYSFMSQPHSFYYFHNMDKLGFRADWVRKGEKVFPLIEPTGEWTFEYIFHGKNYTLDDYFKRNFVTGFLVLHEDRIIFEKYFHEADQNSRFVSQSVSKSIVSILIGAAVEDGLIKSVEDPVIKYLPYLSKSGYRDVTVKNLLQMSTCVKYSENYGDWDLWTVRICQSCQTGCDCADQRLAGTGTLPYSRRTGCGIG